MNSLRRRLDRLYLKIANQDRDALLQELDSNDEAVFAAAGDDGAFDAHKRATLNADGAGPLPASLRRLAEPVAMSE